MIVGEKYKVYLILLGESRRQWEKILFFPEKF
jgi:hypothetical protein